MPCRKSICSYKRVVLFGNDLKGVSCGLAVPGGLGKYSVGGVTLEIFSFI